MIISIQVTDEQVSEMETALGTELKTKDDIAEATESILEGWLSDAEPFPVDEI